MNEDVKKLWVEALRSGKFIKGTGQLRQEQWGGGACHCVLGVLCEVYNEQHPDEQLEFNRCGTSFGFADEAETAAGPGFFSEKVWNWAGIPVDQDPRIDGKPIWVRNDTRSTTFEDLAIAIEAQL